MYVVSQLEIPTCVKQFHLIENFLLIQSAQNCQTESPVFLLHYKFIFGVLFLVAHILFITEALQSFYKWWQIADILRIVSYINFESITVNLMYVFIDCFLLDFLNTSNIITVYNY